MSRQRANSVKGSRWWRRGGQGRIRRVLRINETGDRRNELRAASLPTHDQEQAEGLAGLADDQVRAAAERERGA